MNGPPTALRYMVSGWGRFDARGTNRLTNPVVCLARFCRSWIRIARRAQTAFTLPLPEQVIMTSKIALSRAMLASAELLITATKEPCIHGVGGCSRAAPAAAIGLRCDDVPGL